jgi:hypothetical protein
MSNHTRTVRCLVSFIVGGAFALHQPAVANEPGAPPPPPPDGARSEGVAAHAEPAGTNESSFRLPVWRGIEFPDRTNLTGALLPTSEGTIQIKKIRWGVDGDGFLIVCSLSGYARDGKAVSFAAPDGTGGCTPAASKSDIQNASVSAAGGRLGSFRFGTDQEGELVFLDTVFQAAQLQQDCDYVETLVCVSEDCSGACGTPVAPLEVSAGGIHTDAQVSLRTLSTIRMEIFRCVCTGQTGSCVAESRRRCAGECPDGQSCVVDRTPSEGSTCVCN